jgi:hypothetical protein
MDNDRTNTAAMTDRPGMCTFVGSPARSPRTGPDPARGEVAGLRPKHEARHETPSETTHETEDEPPDIDSPPPRRQPTPSTTPLTDPAERRHLPAAAHTPKAVARGRRKDHRPRRKPRPAPPRAAARRGLRTPPDPPRGAHTVWSRRFVVVCWGRCRPVWAHPGAKGKPAAPLADSARSGQRRRRIPTPGGSPVRVVAEGGIRRNAHTRPGSRARCARRARPDPTPQTTPRAANPGKGIGSAENAPHHPW